VTAGTRKRLAACLAALIAVSAPTLRAASSDDVQKMQDEIAALKAKLAQYESASAPATTTTTTTTTTATPAAKPAAGSNLSTDTGVQTLTPFEVTSDKDNGYLKTNSATATRIGMEIQKIPLSISVVSSDFIRDTGMRSLTDILGYTGGTSGDSHFNLTVPANNPTPQGNFTLRGFPVNVILRDGVFLYSTKTNVDNTDRVEIIKGPAAIFFGQGFPGGVINFITKTASLGKLPTEISYTFGSNNTNRGLIDENHVLSNTAAIRIVAGWENSLGQREFEYEKRFDFTPSVVFDPFANGKLKINANLVYLNERFNQNGADWVYPSGWFQAYAAPSQALINAAGTAVSGAANPTLAYQNRIFANLGAYDTDRRVVAGDPLLPLYTSVARGAYYTNTAGNRVHDTHFNWTNRGDFFANEQTTSTFGLTLTPTDWFTVHYNLTEDQTNFSDQNGTIAANADGYTFNADSGWTATEYLAKIRTHQIDAVLSLDKFGVKSKFLFGFSLQNFRQQYATPENNTPDYKLVPGYNANFTLANPAATPTTYYNPATSLTAGDATRNVGAQQVIKDRFGNVLTATQAYTMWDPSVQVQPPNSKLFDGWANPLDGYPTQYNAWYTNYQATALSDRLTVLGGFRHETYRQAGQALTGNFPWFSPPVYAGTNTTLYPENVYSYSASYALSNFVTQSGNSYMGGASYEITKGISAYASVSQTYRYNNLVPFGGFNNGTTLVDGSGAAVFASLVNGAIAANPAGFTFHYYNGGTTRVTSVAQAAAAEVHDGADIIAPNETGKNMEIGSKVSLGDGKFVGTFSIFQGDRINDLVYDLQHQAVDSLNYGNTAGIPAGQRTFRWRSVAHIRIKGFEAESIYSPTRNFQILMNGSWYPSARTLEDPSVAISNIIHGIYFNNRPENVPIWRANVFGKYTVSEGFLHGLSVGAGFRYESQTIESRSADWNPNEGGLEGGNFMVWKGMVSYPYEVSGYKLVTQFNIDNIFSKKYIDGGIGNDILSPTANWTLTTTLKF
jgi:outer membrane receptor protein involved in Fe transport